MHRFRFPTLFLALPFVACLAGCVNGGGEAGETVSHANGLSVTPLMASPKEDPILKNIGAQLWRFRIVKPPSVDELSGGEVACVSVEQIPAGKEKPEPILRHALTAEEVVISIIPTGRSLSKSAEWIIAVAEPKTGKGARQIINNPFLSPFGVSGSGGQTRLVDKSAWEMLSEGNSESRLRTQVVVRFCTLRRSDGLLTLPDGSRETTLLLKPDASDTPSSGSLPEDPESPNGLRTGVPEPTSPGATASDESPSGNLIPSPLQPSTNGGQNPANKGE